MAKAAKKKATKKVSKKKPLPGFTDGKVTYSLGSNEYSLIKAARDIENQGDIRIDQMVFLSYAEDMPEFAEEMLSDMGDKHAQKILPVRGGHAYKAEKKSKFERDLEDDDEPAYYSEDQKYHRSNLWQAITARHTGKFIVQVSTPVYQWAPSKDKKSKEGSTWLTWGYTTMNWFAGWSMEEIVKQANAWAIRSQKEDVLRAKAEHAKKKPKAKK